MLKILLVVSTLLCPIMMNCVENNNMEQWEKDCRTIRENQLTYNNQTVLTCQNKQEYVDYQEKRQIEIDKRKQEKEEIRQKEYEEKQEKRQKIYDIYFKEEFEKTYHRHIKLSKYEVYESKNYKITVHQKWEKYTESPYPDKTTVEVEKNGEIIYNCEF